MQRTGIFVFYEYNGYVHEYVIYLLKSMRILLNRIIVVSNSELKLTEKRKLEECADELLIRKNEGYDAGAYKDALHKYKENLDCDELILFNGSFYGPLFNLKPYFEHMEKMDADFWGFLSTDSTDQFPEFIHSFFLAFKKNILVSEKFWTYWEEMPYYTCFEDVIKNFEFLLTTYLVKSGFKYRAFIEGTPTNSCLLDATCLIEKFHFPFLKYKALSICNYVDGKNAIEYIKKHTDYNIKMICDRSSCLEKDNQEYIMDKSVLRSFINEKEKIYIYGHGHYARNIYAYIKDVGLSEKIVSFIVSEHPKESELQLDDVIFDKNVGIIVAMGQKNTEEVKVILESKVDVYKILYPKFV